MALEKFKKQFYITTTKIKSKINKNQMADAGEQYQQLVEKLDAIRKYYTEISKRSLEFVRGKHAGSALQHSGPPGAPTSHVLVEKQIADCFSNYSDKMGINGALGSSMSLMSSNFELLAKAKQELIDQTRQNFVSPVTETLEQDVKNLTTLRNRVTNRRTNYDYYKKQVDSGGESCMGKLTTDSPEFIKADVQYTEALNTCVAEMESFFQAEPVQVELLQNFIAIVQKYFQDSAQLMTQLHKDLSLKHDEAVATNPREAPVGNASPSVHATPPDTPKLNALSGTTPMCRALFDFEAQEDFELSLKEHDEIILLEQVDENWFLGELNGKSGHFPITYVEVIHPLPKTLL